MTVGRWNSIFPIFAPPCFLLVLMAFKSHRGGGAGHNDANTGDLTDTLSPLLHSYSTLLIYAILQHPQYFRGSHALSPPPSLRRPALSIVHALRYHLPVVFHNGASL
jgi:hypothetical protein